MTCSVYALQDMYVYVIGYDVQLYVYITLYNCYSNDSHSLE